MKKPNLQDLMVYVALIGLGLLGVVLSCRARDFVGDAYYFELARSIAQGRGYVFDFRPQTMVPPGFPYLLALMTMVIGSKYVVLVRSMAVFFTLALIATYEVLRSEEGRGVAAGTCLLLGSSPEVFQFSTRLVFSDMPYFCTSMMLLWLMMRLDSDEGRSGKRTILWLLSGGLMIISVLMRSTGIALAGGILGWILVSLFRNREVVKRRIRIFLPLAIAGLVVQGAWMYWAAKHQVTEWPIHGYQENYLAQLKLKSGNDPGAGHGYLAGYALEAGSQCRRPGGRAGGATHAKADGRGVVFARDSDSSGAGAFGFGLFILAERRRSSGVVLCQLRSHVPVLALGLRVEIHLTRGTPSLSLHVEGGRALMGFGPREDPPARAIPIGRSRLRFPGFYRMGPARGTSIDALLRDTLGAGGFGCDRPLLWWSKFSPEVIALAE